MPTCDFYAHGPDHRAILDWVFATGCVVYERYSVPDQPLRSFATLAELEAAEGIDWEAGPVGGLLLQLHAPGTGGAADIRRIQLQSNGQGHARSTCEGWGLVQLLLETPRMGTLRHSRTDHPSERHARRAAETIASACPPSAWDWGAVGRFSAALERRIRSLAVAQQGPRVVLEHAQRLRAGGTALR